jgi:capsular exopolysaccharide synthesis family protein
LEQKGIFVNKDFQPEILLTVFKKNWLWIPVMFTLFFSGAFIYLRYTKPIFESTAVIQIGSKDQGKEVIGLENLNTKKGLSEAIELMRSEFLFKRALNSLNLNISYFSKGKFLSEERYLQSSFSVTPFELKDSSLCQTPIFIEKTKDNYQLIYLHNGQTNRISFNFDQIIDSPHFKMKIKLVQAESFLNDLKENQIYFMFNDINHLTRRLLPELTISPLNPEAKTIQISYRSNNSSLSKDIAESVYKSFFAYDEEIEKLSSQNVLRFIDEQLDSLERELRSSKDSIQHFQKISNIPNPDQLETNLSERISQLSSEIFALEMELQVLRSLEQRITNNPNRIEIYQLIPELIGKSFESTLFSQVEDLHNLLEKREDLSFSLTSESPEFKKAGKRIDQRISTIRQSIGAIKERLNARIAILNQQLRQFDAEVFQIPEKKMELSRLKNIQDLNEKYFMLLMDKRSVYSISNAGYASKNIVLKSSESNNSPVSPNKKMVYGAAVFIGLLISLSIIVLKYLMHNEVNSLDDLTMALPTVSVLGAVPFNKAKTEFSKLVVADSPKSMIAEAFRGIRSNLNFINPDTRIIAVSSSISGEGKTFVCLNLAGILAMAGKKVVLIDLDLRKPKVHHGFEAENNIGMSTVLSGQSNIADSIKQSTLKDLYFIPAGPIPPNPSELILSNKMNETVEELKKLFDIIIIDNPPVGLVSDGIGLLATADCPIYVFKANYSKRSFIHRVKELIEVQKIKGLSVILNAVEMKRNRYGYGYGYGNYYEETPEKKWWQKILKK